MSPINKEKLRLALSLLVPRVFANDTDDILALYDATAFAEALDGCSYFHSLKSDWFLRTKSRPGNLSAPVR